MTELINSYPLFPFLIPILPHRQNYKVLHMYANEIHDFVKHAFLFGVHAFLIHVNGMILLLFFCFCFHISFMFLASNSIAAHT